MTNNTIKQGTVLYYDEIRAVGSVLVDGREMKINGSYFHCGWPARQPRMGDNVEIIFRTSGCNERLVYVRRHG